LRKEFAPVNPNQLPAMRLPVLVCLLASISFATAANAQRQEPKSPIQKGSIQVGGTAQWVHDEASDLPGYNTLEILPRVGYFITNGLAINLNLRYRKEWQGDESNHSASGYSDWGAGPGLTYYVTTPSRRLFPFVSARTLLIHGESHGTTTVIRLPADTSYQESSSRSTTTSWLASAGGLFMLSNHVAVSGELFYQHNSDTFRFSGARFDHSSLRYGMQWGVTAFIF
jgi:hypothetical protein